MHWKAYLLNAVVSSHLAVVLRQTHWTDLTLMLLVGHVSCGSLLQTVFLTCLCSVNRVCDRVILRMCVKQRGPSIAKAGKQVPLKY